MCTSLLGEKKGISKTSGAGKPGVCLENGNSANRLLVIAFDGGVKSKSWKDRWGTQKELVTAYKIICF